MSLAFNPDKPNSARIYDYVIGGDHHFAIDRAAAERLLTILPSLRELMLTNRWFFVYAAEQLAQNNFAAYIDFATGLPTGGYLHEHIPAGTKVIYNDIDPVTATYARQILGDMPDIHYVCEDMRNIERILAEAATFFGPTRRIGISMIGIAQHLDDTSLSHILQALYEWVEPGSQVSIRFLVVDQPDAAVENFQRTYQETVGIPVIARTRATITQLMGAWQPLGDGLQDIRTILEMDTDSDAVVHEYTLGGLYYKPGTVK